MDSLGHDLRGSLAVILGTVTTLLEYRSSLEEAVQTDLLDAIKDEVVRLNSYVTDILDQRRRCGDATTARISQTNLHALVLGVTKRVARGGGTRRIVFDAPHVISVVSVDSVLLEQALTNVLENAVDYAPDGSTIIVLMQEHHDCVSISVEDDGCGIRPDQLDAVFQRCVRLDDGPNRPHGAGLGLAITKSFVEAMGGSIDAVSPIRRGRGTRIVMSLPKKHSALAATAGRVA
jgi:two-component system sensor histidine kinase KdpD